MSSAPTCSFNICVPCASVSSASRTLWSCDSSSGILPYSSSEALPRLPARLACSDSIRSASICSIKSPICVKLAFSFCHVALSAFAFSLSSASSATSFSRRCCDALSCSFSNACCSIWSWIIRRSTSSISSGTLSISIRRRDAASSTKSTALSGRKRSEI